MELIGCVRSSSVLVTFKILHSVLCRKTYSPLSSLHPTVYSMPIITSIRAIYYCHHLYSQDSPCYYPFVGKSTFYPCSKYKKVSLTAFFQKLPFCGEDPPVHDSLNTKIFTFSSSLPSYHFYFIEITHRFQDIQQTHITRGNPKTN